MIVWLELFAPPFPPGSEEEVFYSSRPKQPVSPQTGLSVGERFRSKRSFSQQGLVWVPLTRVEAGGTLFVEANHKSSRLSFRSKYAVSVAKDCTRF